MLQHLPAALIIVATFGVWLFGALLLLAAISQGSVTYFDCCRTASPAESSDPVVKLANARSSWMPRPYLG
jgi:hypothetical protein